MRRRRASTRRSGAYRRPLPHGRLEVFPGLGHFGPQQDPDACAASILRFAAEQLNAPASNEVVPGGLGLDVQVRGDDGVGLQIGRPPASTCPPAEPPCRRPARLVALSWLKPTAPIRHVDPVALLVVKMQHGRNLPESRTIGTPGGTPGNVITSSIVSRFGNTKPPVVMSMASSSVRVCARTRAGGNDDAQRERVVLVAYGQYWYVFGVVRMKVSVCPFSTPNEASPSRNTIARTLSGWLVR